MPPLDQPDTAETPASHNSWLDAARSELVAATPDVGGLRNLADKALTGDHLMYAGAAVVAVGGAALIASRWQPIAAFSRAVGEMLGSRTGVAELAGGRAANSELAGSQSATSSWAGTAALMPELSAARAAVADLTAGSLPMPGLVGIERFSLNLPQAPSLLRDFDSSRGTLDDAYHLYGQMQAAGYNAPMLMGRTQELVRALSPIVSGGTSGGSSEFGSVLNQMRLAVNNMHREAGIGDIVEAKVRYQAGYAGTQLQGVVSVNNTLMRSVFQFPNAAELPYDRARLLGVFAHEAVHAEQESEILWRLADGMGLGVKPAQSELAALMKLHPDATRLQGTDWWNRDFVDSVMKARNGVAMSADRGRRADMLIDSFTSDPELGYFRRRYEAEPFAVEKAATNYYLTANHGPNAVRTYQSMLSDTGPGVHRYLSG